MTWGSQYSMKKQVFLLAFVIPLSLLLGAASVWKHAEAGEGVSIGPYTEIRLPLGDLPEPNLKMTFHPVIDQYPSGASLQILHVLEDPREVPLARFAYHSQANGGVMAPTNFPTEDWIDGQSNTSYAEELQRLKSEETKAINVYVRAQAPENKVAQDPLFSSYYNDELFEPTFKNTSRSGGRPSLYIKRTRGKDDDGYEKTYEFGAYHCAVPEYADGTPPYELPDEIGGGQAVGDDGLFDPKAYAPPRPWYYSDRVMLQPGETREGWITCLAPDVPLNEIQVRTWFEQKVEPEPTPTMGPSPTPLGPGYTLEECEEAEDCAVVEDLSSERCQEVSICIVQADDLTISPDPTGDPEQEGGVVFEEGDQTFIAEKIAWDYIQARGFPSEGIRIDNVPVRFSKWQDGVETETKILSGTVTFHTADVVKVDKKVDDYLLISKVEVEGVKLSPEEIQLYRLSGIGAHVEVYDSPTSPYLNASFVRDIDRAYSPSLYSTTELQTNDTWLAVNEKYPSSPDVPFLFEYQADSPYEGYVFANLDNSDNELIGYTKLTKENEPFPRSVWFRVFSHEHKSENPGVLYLAPGHTISNEFKASTNMCSIVECIEVQNANNSLEPRSVPLLCPGEWANNFTIDGMRTEMVNYFGEPPGIDRSTKYWVNRSIHGRKGQVWLYQGKILGGLTPWWSNNNYLTTGRMIDPGTGEYIGSILDIIPFYHQGGGNYYVPLDEGQQKSGWMPGVVSKKMLIAGQNFDENYNVDNTIFLFLEEGPAWKNNCSRPNLSEFSTSNTYAMPNFEFDPAGNQHVLTEILPGADYPVSQPKVTGEVLAMNEPGDKIYDQVFKPVEVRVVPGKKNEPVIYVPKEDKYYPADNVTWYNELFFRNAGAVGIPPSSSLVMVKIERVAPGGQISCALSNANFQLHYPGYYPITSVPGWLRRTPSASGLCPDPNLDFSNTWITFKFPSLNPEPARLVFSIRGEETWNFWHLTEPVPSED